MKNNIIKISIALFISFFMYSNTNAQTKIINDRQFEKINNIWYQIENGYQFQVLFIWLIKQSKLLRNLLILMQPFVSPARGIQRTAL